MLKIKIILPIIFLFLFTTSSFASERFSAAGIDNDNEAIDYFNKIVHLIKIDDSCSLSNEINFPIFVKIQNNKIKIMNKADFINNYRNIFNNNFTNKIINQTGNDLFATWQGVSTSGGEIWFSLTKKKTDTDWVYKIITINN